MQNWSTKILNFYNYVINFYNNESGIYPIATHEEIVNAVNQFLESKPLSEIYFDSVDRESVRTILQPTHSFFIPN